MGTGPSEPVESKETPVADDPTTRVTNSKTPLDVSLLADVSPGATLGRYVVIEELGTGGMGRVLRAYDPRLQREVAVKELLTDTRDAEGTRRLEAEARAMAKLSHPNVVSVFDVEMLSDGRLAMVMEYVEGSTLSAWLDRTPRRPWRDVVARFLQAGRGIAAAHAAGLLHRDFKPANVLVEERDGPGSVKVTDFGLAKVSGEPSSDPMAVSEASGDDLTAAGTVMGTPRYMSPEQHRGEHLTPASDQYSFCVALWYALHGAPPFSGPGLAKQKHAGPPEWTAPHVPRPIVEAIRRGLDPHVERRWPSVDALLAALRFDPARRRRQLASVLAATSLVALGAATVEARDDEATRCTGAQEALGNAWDDARKDAVRMSLLGVDVGYASEVWTQTERALDDYASAWTSMHTAACEANQRGEQSADALDLRMACLGRARQQVVAVTEQLADADADLVTRAHLVRATLAPLSRCEDLDALRQDVEPPLAAQRDAVEAIRSLVADSEAANAAGRYDAAKAKVDEALVLLNGVDYGPVHTEVRLREGIAWARVGDFDRAEDSLRRALELATRWKQWDEVHAATSGLMDVVGYEKQRFDEALRYLELARGAAGDDPIKQAQTLSDLGVIRDKQGQYDASLQAHQDALALTIESHGADHPHVAAHRANIADVLLQLGQVDEAESQRRAALAHQERVFGPQHPNTISARMSLAMVFDTKGDYDAAEREQRVALQARIDAHGADHPDVALARANLALSLENRGKHDEALALQELALTVFTDTYGAEHPKVLTLRGNMAIVLRGKGESERAVELQQEVLEIRARVLGDDHPQVAESHSNLGNALLDVKRYAEAEAHFRQAIPLLAASMGPEHPWVAVGHNNVALALKGLGDIEGAAKAQQLALDLMVRAMGDDHPYTAAFRMNLADLMLEQNRPKDALPLARKAWDRYQADDVDPGDRAQVGLVFGRALTLAASNAEDRARGREILRDVLPVLDEHPQLAEQAEQARVWLAG